MADMSGLVSTGTPFKRRAGRCIKTQKQLKKERDARLNTPTPEEAAVRTAQLRVAAEEEMWLRGDLSYLVLPGAQKAAYEAVRAWEAAHPDDPGPIVLNMHRGAAKTWLLVLLAIERSLRFPNHVTRLGSPFLRQTEEVIEPALRHFISRAPASVKPEWQDRSYVFKNPRWGQPDAQSRLCIFGCRENADSQRGLRANFIALDEVRDVQDADYVIGSVLTPMYVGQAFPLMVLSSTPPATTGHVYWQYADEAITENRYVLQPVTVNPSFTDKDKKVLLKICKSEDSAAWKREALCMRVADESLLAIPSFSRNQEAIVQETKRPDLFFPLVTADIGFIDPTAVLFFYPDYEAQRFVVEDEIVGSSIGTADLARRVADKERALWNGTSLASRIMRWADATPREADDLKLAGLFFSPARSGDWNKWRGLAHLESLFAQDKVRIHPRCKHLIHQLQNAVKNKGQTDLKREKAPEYRGDDEPLMGHADAIFALAYGLYRGRYMLTSSPYAVSAPSMGRRDSSLTSHRAQLQVNKINLR